MGHPQCSACQYEQGGGMKGRPEDHHCLRAWWLAAMAGEDPMSGYVEPGPSEVSNGCGPGGAAQRTFTATAYGRVVQITENADGPLTSRPMMDNGAHEKASAPTLDVLARVCPNCRKEQPRYEPSGSRCRQCVDSPRCW